jgi:hypothetical protein
MEKKKRDTSLTKRFNADDVKNWQEQANLTTGGNLTLWIENSLNKALPIKKVSKSADR